MRIWFLLLLPFLATSAFGEIYRWRDGSGVTHYASSLDDVPSRYRSRVRAMKYGPDPKSDTALPGAAPSSVTSSSVTPPLSPAPVGVRGAVPGGDPSRRSKRGVKRSHPDDE